MAEETEPKPVPRAKPEPSDLEIPGRDEEKSLLRAVFEGADAREALRLLLAACTIEGQGKKSATAIQKEINDKPTYTQVIQANLQNFINCTALKPDLLAVAEYGRWMRDQFKARTPIATRPIVVRTREKLTIDIVGLIERATSPGGTDQALRDEAAALAASTNNRLLYAGLETMFQANHGTMMQFVQNVLDEDDNCRTARFYMYRYTGQGRRIYRSHYTFRSVRDDIGTARLRVAEGTTGEFYINSFKAVGKTRNQIVESSGIVLVQEHTVYMFGNLGGRGIHVAAVPAWQIANRMDRLEGMVLSVDLSGRGVPTPVAAKMLLIRDTSERPADHRAPETRWARKERDALPEFFLNDPRPIPAISNTVELTLKEPVKLATPDKAPEELRSVDSYEDLILALEDDLRPLLQSKLHGLPGTKAFATLLPQNLRGVTALSLLAGKQESDHGED